MGAQHGKSTVITVGGDDISAYTTNSQLTRGADSHDITGYGKNDHVWSGGLGTGEFTAEGWYDNTAVTGPHAVLAPLRGTVVEIIRKPEGTGTGKPLETFDALIEEYAESSPVADIVKWTLKSKVSDAIADTTQA